MLIVVGLASLLHTSSGHAQCQLGKLIAPDGHDEQQFGWDVAVWQGEILVGARGDSEKFLGAGAVYYSSDLATWNTAAKLVPPDREPEEMFGHAVALLGDDMLIGTPFDHELGTRAGAAYLYSRVKGGWAPSQKLTASDGDEYDLFGSDVAISDERVLISAPRDEPGYTGSGYIFERDDSGQWVEVAKLQSNDAPVGNEMGYRVALEGTVAVLSTYQDDEEGFAAGAAYVFEPDEDGVWRQTAKLLVDGGRPFDALGIGLAIGGEQIMVSAPNAHGATPHSGAVYVFERDGMGGWILTQRLSANDGKEWDYFGSSIATDGDLAVIGASSVDDGGEQAGAGYVFSRDSDGVWSQLTKIWPNDPRERLIFGDAVALSGHTAVFGCHYDTPYGDYSGSAYVFGIGPDSDGDGEPDSCACIGDLDGDRIVGLNDFATMLSNYRHRNGSGATYEDGDLDGDGDVDLADVSQMLFRYGAECW